MAIMEGTPVQPVAIMGGTFPYRDNGRPQGGIGYSVADITCFVKSAAPGIRPGQVPPERTMP